MPTLIGSAPNQVPTNADLGTLAYQDADQVIITAGNIKATNFSTGNAYIRDGDVNVTNFITTNAQILGGSIVAQNIFAANIYAANAVIGGGYITTANIVITGMESPTALQVDGNVLINNKLVVQGNIDTNFGTSFINYPPGDVDGAGFGIVQAGSPRSNTLVYYGVYNSAQILADVVVDNYIHYLASGSDALLGANAAITYQIGVSVDLSNSGSINTGVLINIDDLDPSNWAINSTGDAPSYLGGNLTVNGILTAQGDFVLAGNLTVDGTTTTLNTQTLTVEDLNITVANGAVGGAAANGAGITVAGAGATLLYTAATDSWNFNKQVIGQFTTANLQATGGSITGVTGAASTLVATNFSSGNVAITGGSITSVTGDVSTLVATNFSTANGYITGTSSSIGTLPSGALSAIANIYSILGQFTNFSSGNVAITGGFIAGLSSAQIQNISSGNIITSNAASFTNSNTVASTAYVRSMGGFSNQFVDAVAGASKNFAIPAGVTKARITVIGGGGGGGASTNIIGAAAGGGGGGSIGRYYFTSLTPGTNITYSVGVGGNGGAAGANPGLPGGTSNVTVGGITLSAPGGGGGNAGSAASTNFAGGAGATIATQTGGTASAFFAQAGSAGGTSIGTAALATFLGGDGGPGATGGGAGRGRSNNGGLPTVGGAGTGAGGGGAGSTTAAATAGAAGGSGIFLIEY